MADAVRIVVDFSCPQAAFAKLERAIVDTHLALIDGGLLDEPAVPRSWDVEREDFLRRLGAADA